VSRIWTTARVTFHETSRKRVLYIALTAGIAFLILFATGLTFQRSAFDTRHVPVLIRRQAYSAMLLMGAYAIDMLVVAMSVLTSVDTLSGEISSGAIQAIATRPVRRSELMAGKWLGFSAVLSAYTLLMIGGINCISLLLTGVSLRHFGTGLALVWLEAELLLSLSLFLGSKVSTLTNGVLILSLHGFAFLGGWIEQAGAVTKTPDAVRLGIIASLVMPSESLWRRAAIEMQPPLATALQASPFSGSSVPSGLMVGYAGLYTVAFLFFAVRSFCKRDL